MSINNEAIKAIRAFEREYEQTDDDIFVRIRCDVNEAVAANDARSIPEAMLYIHDLSEKGAKIASVFALVRDSEGLKETLEIYPSADEDDGHTGTCCGGCGG